MYNMRKVLLFVLLLLPLCAFTQKISLGVSKDLGWAEWTYESIEFRDDCTIVKGFFVPSKEGCWIFSKMDETLKANGVQYRIIYTTLPTSRYPRTIYGGGMKVYFEEHYEPIFSTGGVVQVADHGISFAIPFDNRKLTKPYEDLLPSCEEHIDTLISRGKYSIAAYVLNRYVREAWLFCSPKAMKKVSKRILSKYRVQDLFLKASPDDKDIVPLFENIYHWLNFNGDDEVLKKLGDICSLHDELLIIELNGSHPADIIKWCESLMTMMRNFGKYNKYYEYYLSQYRDALIIDGQTQRIPELDNEIINVCSHIYNPNGAQYLKRLMNIASSNDIRSSLTSNNTYYGINIWNEVREKAKQKFPNSWLYANALREIADYNSHNRHFDVALKQYLELDSLYMIQFNKWIYEVWDYHDNLSADESVKYVNSTEQSIRMKIASCYYQLGDLISAIKYDGNNPFYHYAYGNCNTLISLCENSYKESMNGLKDIIKTPIIFTPGAYYEDGFDMVYSRYLTIYIPYFAFKTKSVDLFEMACNGALITKEFRLMARNRLQQYINTTQDSVSQDYNTRIDNAISSYQLMRKTHDLKSVDKYSEIIQLQRDLMTYLDSIHALNAYFPDWRDVQKSLKDDEIAIEFIEFPLIDNQNQLMYAALTIRKDSKYPMMTPLFEEKTLKSVSDTLYYQCQEMTNLIWSPLLSELEGIKNVYFSPSGVLYNIGIEFLPGMEKYNIYRVSSTRELVTERAKVSTNRAILYGGLDYYARHDSLSKSTNSTSMDITAHHADVKGMKKRGGKEYLPHTKNEVEQIEKELRRCNWVCMLDTAAIGTEESFKSLSGDGVRFLHLATHGFYYTPEEAETNYYDLIQLDNHIITSEDKALTRSGLIMSGANHILEGEKLPENVEDGILTAKEIADVDLRGLDLVVLSACQTGLGDISQGEGVFGLQRGFKKAGAKSILMSLWEVDDEATQIFMVQFYRNMLSGKCKRQSLTDAQKNLRKYENGKYDDPKYWAAFILLDGLD